MTHLKSASSIPYFSDSRVRAAEDEEGAARRDGRSLLLNGEVGQSLGAWPDWGFWEVVVVVIGITHWKSVKTVKSRVCKS